MERLLIDAAEIGLGGDDVGAMSNYELEMQFKGAQQRKDWWYRFGVSIAWYTANFAGAAMAGKLPDLESVLAKLDRKPAKQTPKEQLLIMHQIAARYGLTMQFRPHEQVANG